MSEQNKAIVRHWVEEYWNKGNLALLEETLATNYVLHDPAGPVNGHESFRQFTRMYRTAFPDIHLTLEDVIAERDKVVWRYTARGTHQGELMGIPPTGKSVTLTGIVISRFARGKWVEDWHNNDTLGLLQQLGAIPAQG